MMENVPFWLLTIAYAAHIMEEYFLNWRKWAQNLSGMKLKWSEFFVANFAVIVLGICSSSVGYTCPLLAYMFVGLAVVNGLIAHFATTIIYRKFSPGLITSITLLLPISSWAYAIAAQKGILILPFLLITLGGGTVIMLFPVMLQKIKRW